ncbi:hypothetical protein D9M68_691360 [compost metagenome]
MQFILELVSQNLVCTPLIRLQLAHLHGHFLAQRLHACRLRGQLRLEVDVQLLLLAQRLIQLTRLRLQTLVLLFMGQPELGHFLFVLLAQAADAQALLLDQLRGLQAVFLIHRLGDFTSRLRGGIGRIPLVFRGHVQALGSDGLGAVILDQQAQVVAFDGVTQQYQVIVPRCQIRIPQVHLMPGHRALTAARQPNRPGA